MGPMGLMGLMGLALAGLSAPLLSNTCHTLAHAALADKVALEGRRIC